MSNTELTKHFLSQEEIGYMMPDVEYTEIIKSLNTHFNGNWTWELVEDTIVDVGNGKNVMTTVTLYVPGHVYTGRSFCKATDYAYNHLRALYNASGAFIDKAKSGITQAPQNNTNMAPGQMSADQISAMIAGNGNFVNTKADMTNYPNEDGTPADRVNFEAISDHGHEATAITPQSNNKWSQELIDEINKFKADSHITNDEEFNRWVDLWHKGWTKKNLTPENAPDFLEAVKSLGEF